MRANLILAAMCSFLAPLLGDYRLDVRHLAAAELLHHLLHLLARGEQLIDLLNAGPAACRDARPAGALDDLWLRALLSGHGQHDRLDAAELALVDVDSLQLLPEPRDEGDDIPHGAHPPHHLVGLEELVEREAALAEPPLELFLLVLLSRGFGALDEREDVPHPQDAGRHPVRMEVLELVELLARRRELDRL